MVFGGFRWFSEVLVGFRGFSGVFGGPRRSLEAPQRLPEVSGDFRFFVDFSSKVSEGFRGFSGVPGGPQRSPEAPRGPRRFSIFRRFFVPHQLVEGKKA